MACKSGGVAPQLASANGEHSGDSTHVLVDRLDPGIYGVVPSDAAAVNRTTLDR
jgi:hypothetical protein